jgi:hypothetical protein
MYVLRVDKNTSGNAYYRRNPEGQGLKTRWGNYVLSNCLMLPSALGPGIYSPFNRMSTRDRNENVSGEFGAAGAQAWHLCRYLWADSLYSAEYIIPLNLLVSTIAVMGIDFYIYKYSYRHNIRWNSLNVQEFHQNKQTRSTYNMWYVSMISYNAIKLLF